MNEHHTLSSQEAPSFTHTLVTGGGTLNPPPLPDRHAAAIAEVEAMRDTIIVQKKLIEDLNRQISNHQDRITILVEERARWRTDAMACRTFVTKLATILEHVNTATVGAAGILDDMAEMDASETPIISIRETEDTVRKNLEKIRRQTDGSTVETMSERSSPDT